MSVDKPLWFSITIKDCRVDTFRAGGKGGQNQNKVESGVRIVHEPSGATGEARDSRDQLHNKRNAFVRMAKSVKFKSWLLTEMRRRDGIPTPEEQVEEWMDPKNLKVEFVVEMRTCHQCHDEYEKGTGAPTPGGQYEQFCNEVCAKQWDLEYHAETKEEDS